MATKPNIESRQQQAARTKKLRNGTSGAVALRGGRGFGTGGGRGPGVQPKMHTAKDVVLEVFMGLGGVPEMIAWAKDNKSVFYTKLYGRLIPKDISLSADAGLEDLLTKLAEKQSDTVAGDYTDVEPEV